MHIIKKMSKYTFIEKLSSGSYGTVSKVERNGKYYADKEYIFDIDLNEVDLLRRFNHPNIIACKDFFKLNDKYHVILDLADGSLSQVNFNFVDRDLKRAWCYQLASALHFIHLQGYTHCDLKPTNILIKDEQIKVADLGLTYPVEVENLCGTGLWTSYELVFPTFSKTDSEVVSFFTQVGVPPANRMSSDIFGLGLLFIYILTGKTPISQYYEKFIDSPLKLEKSYMEYIKNYPANIEDLSLDKDWTELLVRACDPFNATRIKTISEMLNYSVFASRSQNIPIPGKVLRFSSSVCPYGNSRSKTTAAMFDWISKMIVGVLRNRSPFLMMYVAIDLYYRLTMLSISQNNNHLQLYVIVCFYISVKLLVKSNLINTAALTQIGRGKFEEKNLVHYYDRALTELKGVIRSPSLYDRAVSKRECVFGLFCMLNCEINSSITIDELHSNYMEHEREDVITRKNKIESSSQNDLELLSEVNINRFNEYSIDTFKKLGPVIVFRRGIERRDIPRDMLEVREDYYNDINPASKVTIDELQKLVDSL